MSTRPEFILFFVLVLLVPINLDVFGDGLSVRDVGFVNKYLVSKDGENFEITFTVNFTISSAEINPDDETLQFTVESGHVKENIGELIIPLTLFDGEFVVLLDGEEIPVEISKTSRSSIITIVFDGEGKHTIDVTTTKNSGGGCLIATATFGSELSPQVQLLRELRDNVILQTESGTSFMSWFNQFYYSFSPLVADYERENLAFKEAVKLMLVPLLTSLTLLQYAEIDSESEMLGYGISLILANIGIYIVAPAILIINIRKRVNIEKLDKKYA